MVIGAEVISLNICCTQWNPSISCNASWLSKVKASTQFPIFCLNRHRQKSEPSLVDKERKWQLRSRMVLGSRMYTAPTMLSAVKLRTDAPSLHITMNTHNWIRYSLLNSNSASISTDNLFVNDILCNCLISRLTSVVRCDVMRCNLALTVWRTPSIPVKIAEFLVYLRGLRIIR